MKVVRKLCFITFQGNIGCHLKCGSDDIVALYLMLQLSNFKNTWAVKRTKKGCKCGPFWLLQVIKVYNNDQ